MDITKLDTECVNLCLAMNRLPGICTTESCSGHGEGPMRIWFKTDNLDALSRMIFWLDPRFNSGIDWHVEVRTKAPSPGVIFKLESKAVGERAYIEADKLTALLNREAAEDTFGLREKLYEMWLERFAVKIRPCGKNISG